MSMLRYLICLLIPFAFAMEIHAQDTSKPKEVTLSIIKPNAVADHHVGEILSRFEQGGLKIIGIKMTKLTREKARDFYSVHKDRPFYNDLVNFMISGPVVVIALEGPNAVAKNREIMGATDPSKADKGTIRADFGKNITENAVHGSDSVQNGKKEVDFFFKSSELVQR